MKATSIFQGGQYVEVLGTQGTNPLAQWKVLGSAKQLQKTYDKALKGSVFASGNSTGIKLQAPKDDKSSLGLVQPFLVLQASLLQGSPLTLELGLQDASNTRRRLILSSSFTDAKITPLHCQIPFAAVARDTWLNLVIPLTELVPLMFRGATFKCLDSLMISGSCRLRRVFTLRDAPYDTQHQQDQYTPHPAHHLPLPRGLELPPGLDVFAQVVDAQLLHSLGVHLPGQSHSQIGVASPKPGSRGQDVGNRGLMIGATSHPAVHHQQQGQGQGQQQAVAPRQAGWVKGSARDTRQLSSPSPTLDVHSHHTGSREGRAGQVASGLAGPPTDGEGIPGGPSVAEVVAQPAVAAAAAVVGKADSELSVPATWATVVISQGLLKRGDKQAGSGSSRQKAGPGGNTPVKPAAATWDANATDGGIKSVGATGRHGRARMRMTDETVTAGAAGVVDGGQVQLGLLLPAPAMYTGGAAAAAAAGGRPTTDSCTITSSTKWARTPMAGRRAVSAQVAARSHGFDPQPPSSTLHPAPASPMAHEHVPGTPSAGGGQRRGSPASRGQSPARRGGGSPHQVPAAPRTIGSPGAASSRTGLMSSQQRTGQSPERRPEATDLAEHGRTQAGVQGEPTVGILLSDLPTTPVSPGSRYAARRHGSQAPYGFHIPYTINESEAVNCTPRGSSGAASMQEALAHRGAGAATNSSAAQGQGQQAKQRLGPNTCASDGAGSPLRPQSQQAKGLASRAASRVSTVQRTTSPVRGCHPSPGSSRAVARGATPPTSQQPGSVTPSRGSTSHVLCDGVGPMSPAYTQSRGPVRREGSQLQAASSSAAPVPDLEGLLHVRGGLDASIDVGGMLPRLSLGLPCSTSLTASVFARANGASTAGLPVAPGVLSQDPPPPHLHQSLSGGAGAGLGSYEGLQGRASLRPKPIDLAVCRDPSLSLAGGVVPAEDPAAGAPDAGGGSMAGQCVTFPVLGAASPLMSSSSGAHRDRYLRQSSSSSTTSGPTTTTTVSTVTPATTLKPSPSSSSSPSTRGPALSPSTHHIHGASLPATTLHPDVTATTTTINSAATSSREPALVHSPAPAPYPAGSSRSQKAGRHPSPQARAAGGGRSNSPSHAAAHTPMSPARAVSPGPGAGSGVGAGAEMRGGSPSARAAPGALQTPSRPSHIPSHIPVSPASKIPGSSSSRAGGGGGGGATALVSDAMQPVSSAAAAPAPAAAAVHTPGRPVVASGAGGAGGGASTPGSKTMSPARGARAASQAAPASAASPAATGGSVRGGGSPGVHTRRATAAEGTDVKPAPLAELKARGGAQGDGHREAGRSMLCGPKPSPAVAGSGAEGVTKPRGRGAGGGDAVAGAGGGAGGRVLDVRMRGSMASSACEVDESVHLEGIAWGVDEEDILASRHFHPSGPTLAAAAASPSSVLTHTAPVLHHHQHHHHHTQHGLTDGVGAVVGSRAAAQPSSPATPVAPQQQGAAGGVGAWGAPDAHGVGMRSGAGGALLDVQGLDGVGAPIWSSTAPSMRTKSSAHLEALLGDLVLQGDVMLPAQSDGDSNGNTAFADVSLAAADTSAHAAGLQGDASLGFSFHHVSEGAAGGAAGAVAGAAQVQPTRHAGYGDGAQAGSTGRQGLYGQHPQHQQLYMGPAVGGPLRRYTVDDDTLLSSSGSLRVKGQQHHQGVDVDWARVEQLMAAPVDLAAAARAFTPPVIPPSHQMTAAGKQLAGWMAGLKSSGSGPQVLAVHSDAVARAGGQQQQQRTSGALKDRSSAGSLKSRLSQGVTGDKAAAADGGKASAGAGGEVQQGVLRVAQGQQADVMVDLLYDPLLNCYYDQKTGNYFALKP